MIEPSHLLQHIIRPVLKDLNLWSMESERLILGTACQESNCGQYLVQLSQGPAKGIYQCEPATYQDIWDNFLAYRPRLQMEVQKYRLGSSIDELIGNLYYATAICRIHYLRVPEPIPDNLPGQAAYWKRYYNSRLGKGTEDDYIRSWHRFVGNAWVG